MNITPHIIHDFFCESVQVEKMDESLLELIELGDFEFYKKVSDIDDSLADYPVILLPNQDDPKKYDLLINSDDFENNVLFVSEVLLTQLFKLYNDKIEFYANVKNICKASIFYRHNQIGYDVWIEFTGIFLSLLYTNLLFKDEEFKEGEYPYTADQSEKIGVKLLKKTLASTNIEGDFSLLLYAMAKFAAIENDSENVFDIRTHVENEKLKDSVQRLYELLSLTNSDEYNINFFHLIGKYYLNIIRVLRDENTLKIEKK